MSRKKVFLCGLLLSSATLAAQAPSVEQIAQMKSDLEKQAAMGGLLNRAAGCEAKMLDISALKARIAELQALQKNAEKKPEASSPEAPGKR